MTLTWKLVHVFYSSDLSRTQYVDFSHTIFIIVVIFNILSFQNLFDLIPEVKALVAIGRKQQKKKMHFSIVFTLP